MTNSRSLENRIFPGSRSRWDGSRPADIFDTNAYANDPRTQFMNWAFVNNEAWDYPADASDIPPDLPWN